MSKYIDSEKLISEIERQMNECIGRFGEIHKLPEYRCLKNIHSYITSLQQEQPGGGSSEKPNDLLSEWTEEDERTRWNLCSLLTNLRVGKKIEESTFKKYYSWLKIIHIKPRKTRKQEQPVLPGIKDSGIHGKDFIPVEWSDACEQYGKWRIVKQEQPHFADASKMEQPEIDFEDKFAKFLERKDSELGAKSWSEEDLRELALYFYELGQSTMRERITDPEYNQKVIEKMKSEYPEDELNQEKK